jgi:hypothetical protein
MQQVEGDEGSLPIAARAPLTLGHIELQIRNAAAALQRL